MDRYQGMMLHSYFDTMLMIGLCCKTVLVVTSHIPIMECSLIFRSHFIPLLTRSCVYSFNHPYFSSNSFTSTSYLNATLMRNKNELIQVCRVSSVDSSVPTILPPRVRVTSTPSTLYHFSQICAIFVM